MVIQLIEQLKEGLLSKDYTNVGRISKILQNFFTEDEVDGLICDTITSQMDPLEKIHAQDRILWKIQYGNVIPEPSLN